MMKKRMLDEFEAQRQVLRNIAEGGPGSTRWGNREPMAAKAFVHPEDKPLGRKGGHAVTVRKSEKDYGGKFTRVEKKAAERAAVAAIRANKAAKQRRQADARLKRVRSLRPTGSMNPRWRVRPEN